jgi:hypothetical protein
MAADPYRFRRLHQAVRRQPRDRFPGADKEVRRLPGQRSSARTSMCIEQMQHAIYNTYTEAKLPDYDTCIEHMQSIVKVFDASRSQARLNAKTT